MLVQCPVWDIEFRVPDHVDGDPASCTADTLAPPSPGHVRKHSWVQASRGPVCLKQRLCWQVYKMGSATPQVLCCGGGGSGHGEEALKLDWTSPPSARSSALLHGQRETTLLALEGGSLLPDNQTGLPPGQKGEVGRGWPQMSLAPAGQRARPPTLQSPLPGQPRLLPLVAGPPGTNPSELLPGRSWAREVSRANVLLSLPRLPRVQLWPVLVSPASGPGSAVWGG